MDAALRRRAERSEYGRRYLGCVMIRGGRIGGATAATDSVRADPDQLSISAESTDGTEETNAVE